MFQIIILLGIFIIFASAEVSYENFKVFSLLSKTEKDLESIKNLDGPSNKISLWSYPRHLDKPFGVLVAPSFLEEFYKIVNSSGIEYHKIINNVQDHLDREKLSSRSRRKRDTEEIDLSRYNRLLYINRWLKYLVKNYPQRGIKILRIGLTTEGRRIRGIKLNGSGRDIKSIVIEAGIHAREWISTAVAVYLINQLVKNPSRDPDIQYLIDNYDWYIFPTTNPDGYVYIWDHDRFWRKNKSVVKPISKCIGVDLNRNCGYQWRKTLRMKMENVVQLYSGRKSFSETETIALREFLKRLYSRVRRDFIGYISLHSFAQVIMIPYNYANQPVSKDYKKSKDIAKHAADAIKSKHQKVYKYGLTSDLLGQVFGSSTDWVKNEFHPEYTFTFELRPENPEISDENWVQGFVLDPKEIIPTGEETLAALISMFKTDQESRKTQQ